MTARRPLRVMRIIDRLNVGGPAKHVVWLTAGLDRREFETLLVAGQVTDGERDMGYFARAAEIEPLVIPEMSRELSPFDVVVVLKLFRQMLRFRPDVVHTHKSKAGAVARVAAFLYRWLCPSALRGVPRDCKVVHTFHGHTFTGYFGPTKAKVFLAVERLLARFATDCIVTISEQQRGEIGGRFGVGRPEQFRVIPLGIDFDEVATAPSGLRQELGIGADDVLVATVGRLCPIKNQRLFLEAARRITERPNGRPVRFVLVGDGELRRELEEEARRLGISERVTFTGFRQDAGRLYPDFDVMVLTSRNEGTPVTLIEALCAGRPVISTEVGGVVDLLGARRECTDGVTRWDHGFTVPSDDAAALARAVERLIADPVTCRAMGERGRAFVRERMSKERLVAEVAGLYRELAGSNAEQINARPMPVRPRAPEPRASTRSSQTSPPP